MTFADIYNHWQVIAGGLVVVWLLWAIIRNHFRTKEEDRAEGGRQEHRRGRVFIEPATTALEHRLVEEATRAVQNPPAPTPAPTPPGPGLGVLVNQARARIEESKQKRKAKYAKKKAEKKERKKRGPTPRLTRFDRIDRDED